MKTEEKRKTKEGGGGWGGRGGRKGRKGRKKLNDSKYNPANIITHVSGYEITTLYASNAITS